jgi:hypothetical protein
MGEQDGLPAPPPASAGGWYVIRLQGELDASWSDWLGGLEVTWDTRGTSLLCGYIADQGALHGVLTRIRDLGVRLLAVEQLD